MAQVAPERQISPEKLKHVQVRLQELHRNLTALTEDSGSNSDFWRIIHNPGWTTLPDVALATGILESMHEQVKALRGIKQVFVEENRHILGQSGRAAT